MAKQNTIKIDGDFRSINKGFADLGKTVKDLGKNKFALNVDDRKLREAMKLQKDIISSTSKEIQRLTVAMNQAFDDAQVNKLRSRIKDLKKDIKDAQTTMTDLAGGGARGGGIGGALKGMGGGGLGGLVGGLIGGLTIGAAIGAVKFLIGPAMQAASSRMQLRGLGFRGGDISGAERGGLDFGYTPTQSRDQALALARGTGGIGQLGSVQMLSRTFGVDPSELINSMSSLRGAGLSDKDSIRVLKDTFIEAVSAGFDSSRAMDVLQTISEYTGAMAKHGDVSAEGMKSAVSMLMRSSSFFTQNPDRAMGALSSLNNYFTGNGGATAIGYRAISKIMPGASMIDKLWETRRGLFKGSDSTARIDATIGTILEMATGGQQFKAGGGINQMTREQRRKVAIAMKNTMGAESDEAALAMIEGYLGKSGQDRKQVYEQNMKTAEDLQKRTFDIMTSSDAKLLSINVALEAIRLDLSDFILKLGTWLGKFGMATPTAHDPGAIESFMQSKLGTTNITSGGKSIPVYKSTADTFNSLTGMSSAYDDKIKAAARRYGVSPNLLKAIIHHESGFNPSAMSPTGATGLGQATQDTWNDIDPFTGTSYGQGRISGKLGNFQTSSDPRLDPDKSIDFMAHYMSSLLRRNKGNVKAALKTYIDPNDVGWHDENIMQTFNQLNSSKESLVTSPVGGNNPVNWSNQDLIKALQQMAQDKKAISPAIKSDVSNTSKVWFNHSVTWAK